MPRQCISDINLQTLDAFLQEADLPPDTGTLEPGSLTIEKILEEKSVFDQTLNKEKVAKAEDEQRERGWRLPAPTHPTLVSLPTQTNLLHVSVESIALGSTPQTYSSPSAQSDSLPWDHPFFLLAATADRRLNIISLQIPGFSIFRSLTHVQDSPILSCVVLSAQRAITISSGMSGQVVVFDHRNDRVLDERRDHKKYVVKVATLHENKQQQQQRDGSINGEHGIVWAATAGWDGKVFLYRITSTDGNEDTTAMSLGTPVACAILHTNPESVLFLRHPDTGVPVLLITRRDSTYLYYYGLPSPLTQSTTSPSTTDAETRSASASNSRYPELALLGKQNLAPHSNAWIAFSPASMALCPTDPGLLAVATSSVPHMKLLVVRLLFPSVSPHPVNAASNAITGDQPSPPSLARLSLNPSTSPSPHTTTTTASLTSSSDARPSSGSITAQAQDHLARQDREEAAIHLHVSTYAPQTAFSSPAVVWRPDGSGLWVNGDDGVVRGVELKSGRVVCTLTGRDGGNRVGGQGHEPGSKIRTIWCGMVKTEEGEREWVVSGGFDRRLIVWRAGD